MLAKRMLVSYHAWVIACCSPSADSEPRRRVNSKVSAWVARAAAGGLPTLLSPGLRLGVAAPCRTRC